MPLRDVIRKGTFAFEPKDHQSPLRPLKTLLPVPPPSSLFSLSGDRTHHPRLAKRCLMGRPCRIEPGTSNAFQSLLK